MKIFNPINREYVNPIDLNVLGRTYNTLEQGHKEAVKAASDLEITMASLDLNENESEWRQNKINEIRQTISDNTNHGNAYGALDDLISKAGNIASDQGMIGRLKAQQDYKAFNESVDTREDLPQDYKDYFKEKNPYYYEDKVDEKTGRVIGSTKWQPNNAPTKVVPLNVLMNQGLSWAAKESGGGEATRWIDSSGNITTDPSKSFDGQIYNSTTNQWETLSKEKIRQGIQASIASTPGAKESLDQDYEVSAWRHNKEVQANNGEPVVSDITDENGILLNKEEYLFKRVDPMVQASSYYNSITKTNYGSGLATYKAALKAAQSAQAVQEYNMEQAIMGGRDTPIDVPVDSAAGFVATQNTAKSEIKSIYKNITGIDFNDIKDGEPININEMLSSYDVPVEAMQRLRSLSKAYNESTANMKSYTDKMSDNDKAAFEFAARIKAGGELKSSANGGSKYDDKVIKDLNNLYGDKGEKVNIKLSDSNIRKEFELLINGGQYKGYEGLGISITGDNNIVIPKSSMYSAPLIMNILEQARENVKKVRQQTDGIWSKLTKPHSNYKITTLDANNNDTYSEAFRNNPMTYRDPDYIGKGQLTGMFKRADEIANGISNKYAISNKSIQVSSLNLDGNHFTDGTLFDQYNKGILSKEEYDIQKKHYDNSFDNILANTDFSQVEMFHLSDKDNVKRKVVDGAERFNLGSEILRGVKDKRVTVTPSIVPGINDPISGAPVAGYNVTVLPEKGDSGQAKKFYIPGLVNETASQMMMQDPYVQSFNTVSVIGGTRTMRSLTDDNVNPKLGNITLTGVGDNVFMIDYNGIQKQVDMDGAVNFNTAFNNYNAVKSRFLAESSRDSNFELNEAMRTTIVNAAVTIGNMTNTDPNAVLDRLIDDINK